MFLDIDGVMLPFGDGAPPPVERPALFPDRCLEALEYLMARAPRATRLVLSSTWRAHPDYVREVVDEFRRFARDRAGSALGQIDRLATTSVECFDVRQREIHSYLRDLRTHHPAVRAWVAIDDEPLLEGQECAPHRAAFEGHVVQVEPSRGLTMELAQRAVALLELQHGATPRAVPVG